MSRPNPVSAWWKGFAARHKLIAQFVMFYAFSLLVTVLQYVLLTFLPIWFFQATDWASIPAQFIPLQLGPVDTFVFDYPVTGDETGGLGYFAAFAITLFIAQCVNFPMQRNITFKSKGNIWFQAAWYVIAFILITIVCSFLAGLYVPILKQFFEPGVYNILITVINGGVQMVIYFPIYKIIFPEGDGKSVPSADAPIEQVGASATLPVQAESGDGRVNRPDGAPVTSPRSASR